MNCQDDETLVQDRYLFRFQLSKVMSNVMNASLNIRFTGNTHKSSFLYLGRHSISADKQEPRNAGGWAAGNAVVSFFLQKCLAAYNFGAIFQL